MRCAILQSNYLPWKGYFDIIGKVDLFIFHDDLQYTKGDWRNRNLIKSASGTQWLSVPCGTSEKRLICEVVLNDHTWQKKHWRLIEAAYRKAPFFSQFEEYFKSMLLDNTWTNLSEMNQQFIKDISIDILGMKTLFDDSREYNLQLSKSDRVLELLQAVGATTYLSGPAAKDYLIEDDFAKAGIALEWMDYSDYREYPQGPPHPFKHQVSIIDLLFNVGDRAYEYMQFRQ